LGTNYVAAFHVPRRIAPGRVLMHNHVRHTRDMPYGLNGFRAWYENKPPKGFKKCSCGWSGLPHYAAGAFKCDSEATIRRFMAA
jgi:hypothetical protein